MKPFHNARIHQTASMRFACRAVLVLLSACGGVIAQTADVFEKKPTEQETEENGAAKKNLPPPEPVDSRPSRFAGSDLEPYVAARAAVFSMRNRPTDPFGLFQDPNVKPVVRQIASDLPSKRQAALPPTPLADIVKLIQVTTIMPGEKKFLVGVRPFEEGDEFALVFQGKTMNMKIIEVTPKRILFRDLGKGEEAALETGMLPPGMLAGGGKAMRPPGMVSPLENVPLQLESDPPTESRE